MLNPHPKGDRIDRGADMISAAIWSNEQCALLRDITKPDPPSANIQL